MNIEFRKIKFLIDVNCCCNKNAILDHIERNLKLSSWVQYKAESKVIEIASNWYNSKVIGRRSKQLDIS